MKKLNKTELHKAALELVHNPSSCSINESSQQPSAWNITENFKLKISTRYPLNRAMTLVNQSTPCVIERVEFLGYIGHSLKICVQFKDEDACQVFADIFDMFFRSQEGYYRDNTFYVKPTSNSAFDSVLKLLHTIEPFDNNILEQLPVFLSTRFPKYHTIDDWMQTYPHYDPDLISTIGNALSYALNADSTHPNIDCPEDPLIDRKNELKRISNKINEYYADPDLVKIAEYVPGKLPSHLDNYYIASFHYSFPKWIKVNGEKIFQGSDFHFTVQNNDGKFSHRRGQRYNPTRLDSDNKEITLPETMKLFYRLDDDYYKYDPDECGKGPKYRACFDYEFIGYFYFKTTEKRFLNQINPSYFEWNFLEENAKYSTDKSKIEDFKNTFFLKQPLPEFFEDVREPIKKLYDGIKISTFFKKEHVDKMRIKDNEPMAKIWFT